MGAAESVVTFMGPAQQQFSSLQQQVNHFFETYWPNWKNYDEPRSYIIPPIFYYKNSEVSDEAVQVAQTSEVEKDAGGVHALVKHRTSDEAENIVYNAIFQMVQEGYKAPFIAIHSLDIDRIKDQLKPFFPHLQGDFQDKFKNCIREYDFLLIGPHIGIVVIEVKSSDFKQKKHFAQGNVYLPDGYVDGLNQLKSVELLPRLLEKCVGVKMPNEISVRKILFTHNLEKERFEKWVMGLKQENHQQVKEKIGDVIQLFKENMTNSSDEDKPLLYTSLKAILDNSDGQNEIPTGIFETYAPVLAALKSIVTVRSKNAPLLCKLDEAIVSESEAVLMEDLRITTQNLQVKEKSSKFTLLKKAPANFENVMFLNPHQLEVWNSNKLPRQFIFGAAGTGKTVLLQTKAIELLKKGESVTVVAADGYVEHFKAILDQYNFKTDYAVLSWSKHILRNDSKKFLENETELSELLRPLNDIDFCLTDYCRGIYDYVSKRTDCLDSIKDILRRDHLIIDDALDVSENIKIGWKNRFIMASALMAYAYLVYPEKLLWIAADVSAHLIDLVSLFLDLNPASTDTEGNPIKKELPRDYLFSVFQNDCYSVTILQPVMRCSENVFRRAYTDNVWILSEPLIMGPFMGHKFQGPGPRIFNEFVSTNRKSEGVAKLLFLVKGNIIRLHEGGTDPRHIAVILMEDPRTGQNDDSYLLKKLQTYLSDAGTAKEGNEQEIARKRRRKQDDKNLPVIKYWHEVSSLEWPVVIFATCYWEVHSQDFDTSYARYRAFTRATTQLIEVIVTYRVTLEDFFIEEEEDSEPGASGYPASRIVELDTSKLPDNYKNIEKLPFLFGNLEKLESFTDEFLH